MKRLSLLLVVLLATIFLGPSPAYAERTVSIERVRIVGGTAYAEFVYSEGIVSTFVSVMVNDSTHLVPPQQSGPEVVRFVNVSLLRLRMDTGEILALGGGQIEQFEFTVASDLSTAHLTAIVPTYDMMTGYMVSTAIDLNWTASGDMVDDSARFVYRERGFLFLTTSRGLHRDATATGTVMFNDENFAPIPSTSAQVQNNKSGSLTLQIFHP